MLRLDKTKHNLALVFGVSTEDMDTLFRITKGFHKQNTLILSDVLQRLWIDECMSDNVKCWAIFELGRWAGIYETREGGV